MNKHSPLNKEDLKFEPSYLGFQLLGVGHGINWWWEGQLMIRFDLMINIHPSQTYYRNMLLQWSYPPRKWLNICWGVGMNVNRPDLPWAANTTTTFQTNIAMEIMGPVEHVNVFPMESNGVVFQPVSHVNFSLDFALRQNKSSTTYRLRLYLYRWFSG